MAKKKAMWLKEFLEKYIFSDLCKQKKVKNKDDA